MTVQLQKLFEGNLAADVRTENHGRFLVIRIYRSNRITKLPKKLTPEVAYLAGVLLGDGNMAVAERKNTPYPRLLMSIFNRSDRFLKLLDDMFYKEFGIRGTLYKKPDKNCYVLRISCKPVWLYFNRAVGIPAGKKMNLKVPPTLENPSLFKQMMAGLFDTDGYYNSFQTYGIMMTGSNVHFLKRIKALSKEFYGLDFGKLTEDSIVLNGKIRKRVQMNLSKFSNPNFRKIVPLKLKTGGPTQN